MQSKEILCSTWLHSDTLMCEDYLLSARNSCTCRRLPFCPGARYRWRALYGLLVNCLIWKKLFHGVVNWYSGIVVKWILYFLSIPINAILNLTPALYACILAFNSYKLAEKALHLMFDVKKLAMAHMEHLRSGFLKALRGRSTGKLVPTLDFLHYPFLLSKIILER